MSDHTYMHVKERGCENVVHMYAEVMKPNVKVNHVYVYIYVTLCHLIAILFPIFLAYKVSSWL